MMTLEGKATILFDRDDGLRIEIEDKSSGITIEAFLNVENTVAALSRMANVDCVVKYPSRLDLIGSKLERDVKFIDKTWKEYKPSFCVVQDQCIKEGLLVDGWSLWDDGTSSQQNTRGKQKVILERYLRISEI